MWYEKSYSLRCSRPTHWSKPLTLYTEGLERQRRRQRSYSSWKDPICIICVELFWSKFNWTVYFLRCIRRQSCSGRFNFLHLSTLLRSDFSGSHAAKKTLPTCFVLSARSTNFFFFYVFFHGVCKPCNELETSWDWTHKYHKTALLFIICFLYWTFLCLISLIGFFPVICLFWHTLTARDDTRTRQHTRQGRK